MKRNGEAWGGSAWIGKSGTEREGMVRGRIGGEWYGQSGGEREGMVRGGLAGAVGSGMDWRGQGRTGAARRGEASQDGRGLR